MEPHLTASLRQLMFSVSVLYLALLPNLCNGDKIPITGEVKYEVLGDFFGIFRIIAFHPNILGNNVKTKSSDVNDADEKYKLRLLRTAVAYYNRLPGPCRRYIEHKQFGAHILREQPDMGYCWLSKEAALNQHYDNFSAARKDFYQMTKKLDKAGVNKEHRHRPVVDFTIFLAAMARTCDAPLNIKVASYTMKVSYNLKSQQNRLDLKISPYERIVGREEYEDEAPESGEYVLDDVLKDGQTLGWKDHQKRLLGDLSGSLIAASVDSLTSCGIISSTEWSPGGGIRIHGVLFEAFLVRMLITVSEAEYGGDAPAKEQLKDVIQTTNNCNSEWFRRVAVLYLVSAHDRSADVTRGPMTKERCIGMLSKSDLLKLESKFYMTGQDRTAAAVCSELFWRDRSGIEPSRALKSSEATDLRQKKYQKCPTQRLKRQMRQMKRRKK